MKNRLISLLFTLPLLLSAQRWEQFTINEGEGGQRPDGMAADGIDGSWVLSGTDVGGVLQSTDGGDTWVMIGGGFDAYGAVSMAIDPKNNQRGYIVGVGGSSGPGQQRNGVFRSTNKGISWEMVLPDPLNSEIRDRREQIEVDPTSYDKQLGYSTVLYYSQCIPSERERDRSALFRSIDGGTTWSKLTALQGVFDLAVCPDTGALLAGGKDGLYVSTDRGESFIRRLEGKPVSGLDAVRGLIYVGTGGSKAAIYTSVDSGKTFVEKGSEGLPNKNGRYISLKASPANPQRAMLTALVETSNDRFVTWNAGETWEKTEDYKDEHPLICGQKKNEWLADHAWHPTDENICWSQNHDYLVRSSDGGKTFQWANGGWSGIYLGQGHSFHFNVYNPDYIALESLDWHGGVTYDAGKTWTELRFQDRYWGFNYACYAVEPGVFFGGDGEGHGAEKLRLHVTKDGGKTYKTHHLKVEGMGPTFAAYQDPAVPDTWFWLGFRSTDAGETWEKMEGCRAVLTHDVHSKALYGLGIQPDQVVTSVDGGATWGVVFSAETAETLRDVAVDHVKGVVFAVTSNELIRHELNSGSTFVVRDLPKDQLDNSPNLFSVAVDPVRTDVMYLANGAHYYVPDTSVLRSTDGGKTWHSLYPAARHQNLHLRAGENGAGANDTLWVRVNPKTREALFGSNCKGFWQIGPPAGENKVTTALRD